MSEPQDGAARGQFGPRSRIRTAALRLLTLLFGICVAFVIAEIALVFVLPAPPRYRYPQPLHETDDQLGWVLRPNQFAYTIDQPVRTNGLAFRAAEPLSDGSAMRVLCLGDSHTFGNGVAQSDVYPARLEAVLSSRLGPERIEVINAGVQGYDTVQEIELLDRHVLNVKPDFVTLGFYINDIPEVLRKNKAQSMGAGGGQMKRRGLKRFTPYRLIYLLKRSRVITLLRDRMLRAATTTAYSEILTGKTPPRLEESWRVIGQQLQRAQQLAAEHGFTLIVFPIPTSMEFAQDFPEEQYRSRFAELAHSLGLQHLDPTPALKAAGGTVESCFLPWDGHINASSHRFIGEALARAILDADPGAD